MALTYSFRFVDDQINRNLIALMKKAKIKHVLAKNGVVHYSPNDEEVVENELIRSIRDRVFFSWQILSCPKDWTERYQAYMNQHGIPFTEELIDGQLCFLIPRKYRPHLWKLDQISEKEFRLAR